MATEGTDHRKLPRRRGEALNTAILQAALDELTEVGYAGLTMERVAERARTGKASVYRRWPSRMELVLDAVNHAMPDPMSTEDHGSLREDALALLRRTAEMMAGPPGEAMRALLSDAIGDLQRIAELRRRRQGRGAEAMRQVALRAVERGEVHPDAVTDRRVEAGHAMLRHYFLFNGPVPDEVVVSIVDEVVVPLLTSPPPRV